MCARAVASSSAAVVADKTPTPRVPTTDATRDTKSRSTFVWELVLCTLAIVALVSPGVYRTVFNTDMSVTAERLPSPVGLALGIGLVAVGQVLTIAYYVVGVNYFPHMKKNPRPAWDVLTTSVWKHLSNPEGFYLLALYLSGTWMFNMLPASYYSFDGAVSWTHVLLQLLCVDFFQFLMHIAEHKVNPKIYKISHKPHHHFIHPRLTDAFDGSAADTTLMVLIPLFITANLVHCNVWSYMAFGAIYGNYLCLIHAEFDHPWDSLLSLVGIATPGDHRVHHAKFKYNYGHLFTYFDRAYGTYHAPMRVGGRADTGTKKQA